MALDMDADLANREARDQSKRNLNGAKPEPTLPPAPPLPAGLTKEAFRVIQGRVNSTR